MKKTLIGFAVSALFAMGSAQAAGNDTSATLNITGTVTAPSASCAVQLGATTVNLEDDITNLVNQNQTATHANEVAVSVVGEGCANLVEENHIAYKFVGATDNAAGTALANSDVTAGAATGAGIGDEANAPVKINSDTLLASQADKFKLQMVKLDGQTPVAGSVLGSLTVQIERM